MQLGRDMTEGSIPRHLLAVALPMLLHNFLNTAYSIIDTIWLGKMVGKEAVGATAASMPIMFIFIALAGGVTMATTILVSQYYGAKNYKKVEQVVGCSFSIALLLGIVLTIAGISTSDFFLRLMGTPETILPMASGYLKISYVGFVAMYFSFLIISILRGVGDTKTPLIFTTVGVLLNAALDPLLIIGVGPLPQLGLNGAAIASVISSAVALSLGIVYLNKKGTILALRPSHLNLKWKLAAQIFRIGLPSTVQHSIVSLGMAAVTSVVNGFGTAAIAAFGATGRLDSVSFMPAMSIGMAVSALAGQNLGAGNTERVRTIFKWGMIMTLTITVFFSILFVSIPGTLLNLFIDDPEVKKIGTVYLRIVGPSSIMFAVMFVSNGVINGAGHTITTMLFTLVSLWGIRVPLAVFLSKTSLGIVGVWISFSVSFAVIMSASLLYYRTGRWKKIVTRIHDKQAPETAQLPEPPLAQGIPGGATVETGSLPEV
jgi:putative MATE family efflux protein